MAAETNADGKTVTIGNIRADSYSMDPITDEDRVVDIDLGGKPIKCLMVDDLIMFLDKHLEGWGPDLRRHVSELRNMEMDEEDTIICSASKSGTNWITEITNMLVQGKADYKEKDCKVRSMLEFISVEDLRAHPRPRVYNTHATFSNLPRQAIEKNCKIILSLRNLKDSFVSLLPFFQGLRIIDPTVSWNEYIEKCMALETETSLINLFYYVKSWYEVVKNKPDNIHCIMFEDLKEDPEKEITKLARFLNLPENKSLVKEIAERCSFKNLRNAKKDLNVYRKGEVGDWKNYFTVAQNEKFDAVYAERMKDVGFKFRYTL